MDKPPLAFQQQISADPESLGAAVIQFWEQLPIQYLECLGFNHLLAVLEAIDPKNGGVAKLPRHLKEIRSFVIRRLGLVAETARDRLFAYDLNVGNSEIRARLWADLIGGRNNAELWLDIYYRAKPRSKSERIVLKALRRCTFSAEQASEILINAPARNPLRKVIRVS